MATLLSRSAPPEPSDWDSIERWIEVRSQRLANKMARLIRTIVRDVYGEFIETVEMMTVTAAGDINVVDKVKPRWEMVIPDVMEDVEEMYLSGAISAFGVASSKADIPPEVVQSWTDVVNESAVSYMAGAENRLRGVGDTLWKDVRSRAMEAVEKGLPRDELAAQLRELSDKFSGYRADVIARTEINGAYMNGDYEADLALGEFGPVEKVWVARDDGRTRPWHLGADGQYVLFSEPFDVGDEPMMFPHDPGASAANVVNCRCHYEALYLGDERPDGTIVGEDELVQAQEEANAVLAEEEAETLAEEETVVEESTEMILPTDEADLLTARQGSVRGDLPYPDQDAIAFAQTSSEATVEAVQRYTGTYFKDMNYDLRAGTPLSPRMQEVADALDGAIAQSTTPIARVTYRGQDFDWLEDKLRSPSFASQIEERMPIGSVIDFGGGYASTTTSIDTAWDFTTQGRRIMFEIESHHGLPVRSVSAKSHEMEILLGRRSTYEVVSVREEVVMLTTGEQHTVTMVQIREVTSG